MNKITITIETSNDAFADNLHGEVAGILKGIAEQFASGQEPTVGRDTNGNRVVEVSYE